MRRLTRKLPETAPDESLDARVFHVKHSRRRPPALPTFLPLPGIPLQVIRKGLPR